VRTILRYHWNADAVALELDERWRLDYIAGSTQSYGWDVVLDGAHAWFMDNGRHRYLYTMVGAGASRSANRLIRVSMADARDHQHIDICGLPGGSVTNPPLVDLRRRIVVAYDSANRFLRGWRFDPQRGSLQPLWHKPDFGCASHMVLYPDSGELLVNDYRALGEEVVVLDITTGIERARVRSGGLTQGVVFPSPGWDRDVYWSSMRRLARIFVA